MRSPPSRRRSSLVPPATAKPGTYRARPISFAPNVTPDSYDAPASDNESSFGDEDAPTLFPPSSDPVAPSKRRQKKRDPDHVPRPPNAFMLFRADFVRQRHVPGSIETNHGSLSKIIGSLWRSLPQSEKKHWEQKAKHEKHLHAKRYPNYKYKPVHNRGGPASARRKDKQETPSPMEEERCEDIAQLLLDGNKGKDLAEKVAQLDRARKGTPAAEPMRGRGSLGMDYSGLRRRSSSVPPELTLPSTLHLPRRPSSASGYSSYPSTSFVDPPPYLPAVNTSLFNPSYLHSDPFSQHQYNNNYNNATFAYETPSPFENPPSFYTNSTAPSPAPSSSDGQPPLYAPQPIAHTQLLEMEHGAHQFLTSAQRLSISEGRFSFSDLSDDQRLSLRQSFSWARNMDYSSQEAYPYGDSTASPYDSYPPNGDAATGYTPEFSFAGKRFSLSEVDFAALMECAAPDIRNMPVGLGGEGEGCVNPGDIHRDIEAHHSPSAMNLDGEAY